jgi:hypothetical protein
MRITWWVAAVALLASATSPVQAQTSFSGLPATLWVEDAGLAGAGALNSEAVSSSLRHPSVFPEHSRFAFSGTVGRGGTEEDLLAVKAGVVADIGTRWLGTVAVASTRLRDVIDDPSVSDDGLRVEDVELRIGAGYRLLSSGSVAVGATGELFGTDLFDVSVSGVRFGASVVVRPVSRIHLLASVDRLGAPVSYRSGGTTVRREDQGRVYTLGARLALGTGGCCAFQGFADFQREEGPRAWKRVAIGTQVALGNAAFLRFGGSLNRDEMAPKPAWDFSAGAGLGVRLAGIGLDFAWTQRRNDNDYNPALMIGIGWRSPRAP